MPVKSYMLGLYGGFKLVSVAATAFVLLQPDYSIEYGIWAVFLTSAASVLTNWFNNKARLKELDQKHQWEVEDRREQAERAAELQRGLAVNTAITLQTSAKADRAYEAANHVNEKIAKLGLEKVESIRVVTKDTNDTVHRVEDVLG